MYYVTGNWHVNQETVKKYIAEQSYDLNKFQIGVRKT